MEKTLRSRLYTCYSTVYNPQKMLGIIILVFIFQGLSIAQTVLYNPLLQGFDEAKVLDEFRQKEGSEDKYPAAYSRFLEFKKQEYIGKKQGTWQKSLSSDNQNPTPATAGECGNIDFETGNFTDWTGKTGSNPGCCGSNGFVSNGANAAVTDPGARHTIISGNGTDPCGGFPVVPPPMPGQVQGTYSCRLGNAVVGAEAESIETVFTPTSSNNVFTYQYATVLENPGHSQADQPFFKVQILDSNGNPIPCTTITYTAGEAGLDFQDSPNCPDVQYKPWSTVSVDLVAHIGNPVTVRFTSADCTAGGHYGYGYINTECSALIVTQQDSLCVGGNVTLIAPEEDNNTYSWTGPGGPYTGQTITVTQAGTYNVTMTSTSGCVKLITYTVVEYPTALLNIGPDQNICSTESATLTATPSGAATGGTWTGGTGTFNPSNTSPNCTYTPSAAEKTAGTVTLTFTTNDPVGPCPAVSDQVTITINPEATVTAGPDQTICIGNSVVLGGNAGGAATSGFWTGGAGTYAPDNTAGNAVYTPSSAEATGGYAALFYTTDDPAGPCPSKTDTMVITINQLPTANAGSPQFVCEGESITLAGSIGGTATSATWSGGGGTFVPNNTTLNAVYTPSAAEYAADSVLLTLTTDDPAGPCTFSSSSVKFHFYKNPVVDFVADDPDGCPIHCVNFSDSTTVGGGATIVSWNWDFGDGSTGSTVMNPSNCFEEPGLYDIKLVVESDQGCTSFLTIPEMIEVYNVPVAEFTPSPSTATVIDPTITFVNNSSPDVNFWQWDFGDGDSIDGPSSPVHEYPHETYASYMVTLMVQNANGCMDTVAHPVYIGPEFTFFIPNAFTPNGDGHNEYFFGSGIGIEVYDIWIFDRWGNMIFHGNDLDDKWDGKSNGGKEGSQIDVFIWKVQLTDVFKKVHNYMGTVTLAR